MKIQLRSHSDLSIIDGIIAAENIPKIAKEKGYDCIALTDLMNMFGFVKFYKNCLKNKIKPILGVELLLNNNEFGDYKILMLAKNNKGLVNIFELITNAYTKYKDLFLGEIKIPDDFILSKKNKIHDVFILSGGIYSEYVNIIQQDKELALKERLLLWKSIYENDYFIELQKVQTRKYHINILNKKMYQLANDLNIKVVATHPIYFNETQDYIPHQIKKCNIEKIKLDKNNIESLNQEYTYDMYFLDSNEFSSRFNEIQEEITTNLNYIKDNCNVELRLGVADLPEFPIPKNETIESYFKKIAIEGLKSRLKEIFSNENDYKQNEKIYFDRLNYELETIIQMKFPGYFLIVADFINWAKENDIPVGAGRGSGAGSLVAYSLRITDLNPIPYDLLFERFLNPERVSMPDFDIDFCQEKRGLVIDYVTNKYGKECVSQIATFGTMASKAVINDVVRVLNYPYNLGASLTKKIPFGYNLESAYNEDNDLQALADKDEEVKDIWDNALKLEGLARSIGKHAAGVVIAPSKISDYCPLYQTEGNQTSQLDKVDVEDVGLVKFDFLGLKNLTIIHDTLQMIKNQKNIEVKLDTQKFNDVETFKILQDGNTTGIFQVESSGMKSYLVKMQPDCFEDIIAMLALYRPGPLGSGMVDDFIKRKRWEKNGKPDPQNTINFSDKYQVSNYFVPALEDCLKPTYGIIVYQEQVMKISQIIAGYSLGGADLLRRAMGKKKAEEMAQQRSIFLEGAEKNGYSNEMANHLFDLMESFAEYGFNKSHSAAYAVITYHTAFLKRHYLAYFMSATMSSDMNNLEHLEILINDAKDNNLEIVNPDINKSDYKFQPINDTTIIYSFGALKGITEQSAKQIIEERTKNGFYKDINDFLDRCFEFIDKKILLALVCSGCFDSLNVSRKSIFENIDSIIKQKRKLQKTKNTASLFENYELSNFALSLSDEKWNINYQLEKEFDIIGFHLTDNLFKKYNKYKIYNEYLSPVDFKNKSEDELIDLKSQSRNFKICGIIKEHKMGTGAFLVIYDYSHKIKLYFSDSALTSYKIHQEELITNAFVVLNVNFSFKNIDEEIRVSFYINDILEIK
jgi:DNA polymerase-3 subunit alpha